MAFQTKGPPPPWQSGDVVQVAGVCCWGVWSVEHRTQCVWTPAAGSFPKKMSCSVPTGTIQNDKGKTCHVFFKQLFIFYADDTKLSDALSSSSSSLERTLTFHLWPPVNCFSALSCSCFIFIHLFPLPQHGVVGHVAHFKMPLFCRGTGVSAAKADYTLSVFSVINPVSFRPATSDGNPQVRQCHTTLTLGLCCRCVCVCVFLRTFFWPKVLIIK